MRESLLFNPENIIQHQKIYQYKARNNQQIKGIKYSYSNGCQKSLDKIQQLLLIIY